MAETSSETDCSSSSPIPPSLSTNRRTQPAPRRGLELDVHELEAPAVRHPLGDAADGFERLGLSQVPLLQKKEWGEPTLVQHPELEQ